MKKHIVFYVADDWAIGSVHYELIKYLWLYDINAELLPWDRPYSREEMHELANKIDYFVSLPSGVAYLIDQFGIAPEKCMVMAHARVDLEHFNIFSAENKQRLRGFAVVSDWLAQQCADFDLGQTPMVTPVGINYQKFWTPVSDSLTTVGFAGTYHEADVMIEGYESQPGFKKRGHLAREVAERAGLNFSVAQHYHHNYVTMSGFYPTVDCVVVASTEEGAGLPALEAAAAGRLVITTAVGHWSRFGSHGAHIVPMPDREFVTAAWALLTFYKHNPEAYQDACSRAQEHARSYNWSNVIHKWIEVLK